MTEDGFRELYFMGELQNQLPRLRREAMLSPRVRFGSKRGEGSNARYHFQSEPEH